MSKMQVNIFENLSNSTVYLISAGGLFLVVLFFSLMFRFAEAERLSLVLLMGLLASLTAIFVVRFLVSRLRGSDS